MSIGVAGVHDRTAPLDLRHEPTVRLDVHARAAGGWSHVLGVRELFAIEGAIGARDDQRGRDDA